MTFTGPWVQPDDTEAAPSTTWWYGSNGSAAAGRFAAFFDEATFELSVQDVTTGAVGPTTITAALRTTALVRHAQADKVDVSGGAEAIGFLSMMAPQLESLDLAPVPPDDIPPNAVDYEYEHPTGTAIDGTIRVYGYAVVFGSVTSPSTLLGSTLRRLTAGSYTIDGLDRPVASFTALRFPAGGTVTTIPAPTVAGVREILPFEIDNLSVDANGRVVLVLMQDHWEGGWLRTEGGDTQLRSDFPLFPPSAGTMPFFTQLYTPPRYRFIYDVVPPLRQFPRSDGLVGTGGARQRSAGSRQASNRQGWSGTYW